MRTNMRGGIARASAGFSMPWSRPFDDPIPLPGRRELVTLRDAGGYIAAPPRAKQQSPERQGPRVAFCSNCEPSHIPVASLGVSDRTLPSARRDARMNRRALVTSVSNATPKINVARSYLQLQRLRQLVQEAERSLTPHGVNITSPGSTINPQRRHSG